METPYIFLSSVAGGLAGGYALWRAWAWKRRSNSHLPMKVMLGGKPLEIRAGQAAERAITQLTKPLHIELELYFSCLIRQRVNFLASARPDVFARTDVTPNVSISFRPVVTKTCKVTDVEGDETPLELVPLVRPDAFIPKWVELDYIAGAWRGEWGYR